MIDSIITYIKSCSRTLPVKGIIVLSIVLCLLAIVFWIIIGRRKNSKWLATFLLVEYLVWVVFLVLISRSVMPERRSIMTPFWSYHSFIDGYPHLHPQVILNVLVFIPVGVLLGCASDKMKWWKVLLFGASFSILIEVLQYVTKRGFAEFDDVFNNTLGCLIGFVLYAAIAWVIKNVFTAARKKCGSLFWNGPH